MAVPVRRPRAARASLAYASGLHWLPCDHPEDGDFLLAKLSDELARGGRTTFWVKAPREDPALVWSELLGQAERPGAIGEAASGSAVLVEGGALIPGDGFASHGATVARAASGGGVLVIWPMHRRVIAQRRGVLRTLGTVMRAASCVRPSRRAFHTAVELLDMLDPDLLLGVREDIAGALARAGPNSREELRGWIDYYVRQGVCLAMPPPMRRMSGMPEPLIDGACLRRTFDEGIQVCGRLTQLYVEWFGSELLPLPHLPPPDHAQEMRAFFIACVSWLATLLFDSALPAFRTVDRLERRGSGLIFQTGTPSFMADLRSLRTYFQHGLKWTRPHDMQMRDRVGEWCVERCGFSDPPPSSWRALAFSLLSEWVGFLQKLYECSLQARTSGTAELQAQLRLAFHEIDQQEWVELCKEAATALAPHLAGAEVAKRRWEDARCALRESGVVAGSEREQARILARRYVVEAGAECPLRGGDLAAAGFKGKGISLARQHAYELFRRDPDLDAARLLDLCLLEWPRGQVGG